VFGSGSGFVSLVESAEDLEYLEVGGVLLEGEESAVAGDEEVVDFDCGEHG